MNAEQYIANNAVLGDFGDCVSVTSLRRFLAGKVLVPVEFIQVLQDSPEINPSNYDHDQVCRLNTAVCEALSMLAASQEQGK